ncbi:MAG: hypothetical protein ABI123_10395 [Ginsengibacter sp.]
MVVVLTGSSLRDPVFLFLEEIKIIIPVKLPNDYFFHYFVVFLWKLIVTIIPSHWRRNEHDFVLMGYLYFEIIILNQGKLKNAGNKIPCKT